MTKLALVVDKLDAVPEPLRELYSEQDGKFRLEIDGLEDTSGLKSALEKERRDRSQFEKQVKAWQNIGKSADEIAELIREHDERQTKDAEKKGEWEKLRQQMVEKHDAALRAKDEESSRLRSAINEILIEKDAVVEIAKEKGVPELLLPVVTRQLKVVEEDGKFAARVVDAKGDPRVDGKGQPMSISALVAEIKGNEIYGRAFDGSGHSGSGKLPNGGAGGTGKDKKQLKRSEFDALTPIQRQQAMSKGVQVVD